MINNIICNKNKSLKDVLEFLNSNGKGIVFIIDDDNKIFGVITDGDIRRALLVGHSLSDKAFEVANKKFVCAKRSETYQEMLSKIDHNVRILPIVDDRDVIIDYFEYRSEIHFPMVVLNLKGNELNYLMEAFKSTWISSSGKFIQQFEESFSEFCGSKWGVAVSNGTAALHLALLALGIGQGDEVIVPDLTFAATINAVLHANATPVIVDIEPDSWCIDPKEIEKAVTVKTKAIIPVHLYGQPADMKSIMKIAKKYKLFVIEDAAEAHGAEFAGKKVGSIGDIGCFSFFGNKVITTGEGGMCLTNSDELNNRMRILRDHGMSKSKKYWHDLVGYNYRMTNMQAAIGVAQLERIKELLIERENIENEYKQALSDIDNLEFQRNNLSDRKKITWLVSALVKNKDRDMYMSKLRMMGIDSRPFFYALSDMDIYKAYVKSNRVSRDISRRGLNFSTTAVLDKGMFQSIGNIFQGDGNNV